MQRHVRRSPAARTSAAKLVPVGGLVPGMEDLVQELVRHLVEEHADDF